MPKPTTAMGVLFSPFLPQKLRVAVYIRKSNKDDEGRTKSLDEQLAHCKQVAAHYGFEVQDDLIYIEPLNTKGEWYWDDGAGRHPEPFRQELTRMMRDAEAGLFDVILCWRSDRLFRDAGVANALAITLRKLGVRLICGVRDMDINSASGLFQVTTEAANNRRWRDQISEDIRRDHQFKAELGMITRNPTCLGFRSKGRKSLDVVSLPEELELVNLIFRLFVCGDDEHGPLGTMGIASYLMDNGIRWPKGMNNHKIKRPEFISHTQVRFVLTNCMYVGLWRHNGQEHECEKLLVPVLDDDGNPSGKRQTAVPVALYEDAQKKLLRDSRPGKRSLSSVHIATGLAVCARCGRPLVVQSGQSDGEKLPTRFRCRRQRGDRPCPHDSCTCLQESVLDEWLLDVLAPVLVAEMATIRASAGREADQERLSRVERKLAELRKRETVQLAMLVGVMDAEQYSAVAGQFRADREALTRETRMLRDRIDNAERVMPDLSPEALRNMPRAAVKDALSRALAFIAIGKKGTGVLALTRWGSYIAAPFRQGDPDHGEHPYKTFLGPASPAVTLTCLDWLSDPAEFVRGRRDSLGKAAEGLSDAELLPGVLDVDAAEEGGAVIEIVVEEKNEENVP